MNSPLIQFKNLSVHYSSRNRQLLAVKNLSLTIPQGATIGLVGESGSGKSTVGNALLRLNGQASGSIYYKGAELLNLSNRAFQSYRQKMQMIFQDPYSSLNPKRTIEESLLEPLQIHNIGNKDTNRKNIQKLLEQVHLPIAYSQKHPKELSGGERQRVIIARALLLNPEFIFCDEPISSLDAINQKEVLELLQHIQNQTGISYLFVSHDLPLVCSFSDIVAVMYLGEVIEKAPSKQITKECKHPYTQALFSAVPLPDPKKERVRKRIVLQGEIPSLHSRPSGCPFHTRCHKATQLCKEQAPPETSIGCGHTVRCHFPSS